jgi:hypothetical protein
MNKRDTEKLRILNFAHISREAGQCDTWLRYDSGHEELKKKLLPLYDDIIDIVKKYKADTKNCK